MKPALVTLTLTNDSLSDILDSVLTSLPKAERNKIKKAALKNALIRQPKAARVSKVSKRTLALAAYKNNLKLCGFVGGPGKGGPKAIVRQAALDMLSSAELRDLGFGHDTKFCKTAPVFHAVSLQQNVAELRV
jgi:hypothetical protein